MKHRIISCTIFLVVLLTLISTLTSCGSTEKIPIPSVKENVYIYDEDNIISNDVEENLNAMLVELEDKTEAEFVVISVESLLDKSIEDYANNLFNTLGIGKKDKDNGVLLLISRSDERVRLEIGRGLEGCLNDSKCGRILDNHFVPYRETDEYTTATVHTVYAVLQVLCEEYDISINGLDTSVIQDEETENEGLSTGQVLLIIIGIIVILIILELVTGYWFGDGFGDGIVIAIFSSGGGSSSGSFGGGFSGGGGASR